ncbi:hypothetical protein GGR88_000746 [Sphingomonas jejuensis]|uniref:Dipeptidyl-peptidase n=1 Tax=Sphingomonas jejuensis TaxID=904715 RepID=A0ABX0XKG2_9SPHN|nr:S46 family peptidase [Sphingomonas jejuensis]NJC33272.1 hypothetical protein [Sphingomonas jejuensis]
MKAWVLGGAAALSATMIATAAWADEGMWLPRQTQDIAAQVRAAGLEIDPALLSNLQAAPLNAIVSLGGCSASFVSPQGLVATNHHCVQGSLQYNSSPDQDRLTNGFLARRLQDEVRAAPGSRIFVIEELRDVTADMNRGLTARTTGIDRYNRLEENRKSLIAACERQPSRRCDVRAYYGGSTYFLQQQLEIKDVRLVYAPAMGIGNFGGETDNWMWPRHTGDFGFYRAYVAPDGSSADYSEANVPYRPRSHLRIATEGVTDGDFVMVAGFPGTTSRLVTAEEAIFQFDQLYPVQTRLLTDYANLIEQRTEGDQAAQIKYASILAGVENYEKKSQGEIAGAKAIDLAARKTEQQNAYRSWIREGGRRRQPYATAARDLDALVQEANATALADTRLGTINRAQLYAAAKLLYRYAQEQQKPDAERESGYQQRDRLPIQQRLQQIERRYDARVDRAVLEQALVEYRKVDAASRDAAFERTLEQIGLDRLYADTELDETAARLAWLDRPVADFERSTDPFIRLAVASYDWGLRRETEAKTRAGRTQAARSVYLQGMREWADANGRPLYPDANGSLRFTYGKVTGRQRDGLIWTPFTTAEGLLAKHTGEGEFDLPDRAVELIRDRDYGRYVAPSLGTLPVDYLSTVDITNGNSGSATLNARGEFVGLAFDGTLDGVISDWSYDPTINRTIHVDSRFMLWTMDKVDGADRLLEEMGVRR